MEGPFLSISRNCKKALDNGAYGFLSKQSMLTELPEIYKNLTGNRM
jgi:hypothetical protein